jgi:hypothetical protein
MLIECTYDNCRGTTDAPRAHGWSYLFDWGHGIESGDHCPAHAATLEAVLMDGGFDDPENDSEGSKLDEEDADVADLQRLAGGLCMMEAHTIPEEG